MDFDDIWFRGSGVSVCQEFTRPSGKVFLLESMNSEYCKNGKFYCWVDSDSKVGYLARILNRALIWILEILQKLTGVSFKSRVQAGTGTRLVCIDERTLEVEKQTDLFGVAVPYVGNKELLLGDEGVVNIVDLASLESKFTVSNLPEMGICIHKYAETKLLFRSAQTSMVTLYEWPSLKEQWSFSLFKFRPRCFLVLENVLVVIHSKGVLKIEISSGKVLDEFLIEKWFSEGIIKNREASIVKQRIHMEQTAVYANTLPLTFSDGGMAGIDIGSGEIKWTLDISGPAKLRVTQDGIGWYIRRDQVHRLQVETGELLDPLKIQFSPVLDVAGEFRVGAFDISNTHLVAESTITTDKGKQNHILGINRQTGIVDWAEVIPIEGMLTKLYLLNNRLYMCGAVFDLDTNSMKTKMCVVEGEGGYRCQ